MPPITNNQQWFSMHLLMENKAERATSAYAKNSSQAYVSLLTINLTHTKSYLEKKTNLIVNWCAILVIRKPNLSYNLWDMSHAQFLILRQERGGGRPVLIPEILAIIDLTDFLCLYKRNRLINPGITQSILEIKSKQILENLGWLLKLFRTSATWG